MQVAPVFTPIPWLWGCLLQGEKMRVLIAIDSLKGSLTSMEAGNTIAEGIKRVYPKAELHVSPLADGGEGTAEALTAGLKGSLQSLTVTGPLGAPMSAGY